MDFPLGDNVCCMPSCEAMTYRSTSVTYCNVLLSRSLPMVLLCIFIAYEPFTTAWSWPLGHTLCCFSPLLLHGQPVTARCCTHGGFWGSLLPPCQWLCSAVSLLGYHTAHKQPSCWSWDSGGGTAGQQGKAEGKELWAGTAEVCPLPHVWGTCICWLRAHSSTTK